MIKNWARMVSDTNINFTGQVNFSQKQMLLLTYISGIIRKYGVYRVLKHPPLVPVADPDLELMRRDGKGEGGSYSAGFSPICDFIISLSLSKIRLGFRVPILWIRH